ncbi:MAG TPA: GNAT family N-acetyltransferase [bacterium]|jgi:GNAT superfamily N-acetyltransferase
MKPHTRFAVPSDLTTLAALCRAAVGPDDYVLEYLPEMVADKEILVAVASGHIRAMTGLTECADGALWIGQLRTHPRWRRRGLARALLDHAYARVIRERRPALRLWTSQHNVAARTLFESDGFRPVAVFSRMQARGLPSRIRRGPALSVRGMNSLLRRWKRSLFSRHAKGYLDYRWRFIRLNGSVIRTLVRRGELFVGSRNAFLLWNEEEVQTHAHVVVLTGGKATLRIARRTAGAKGHSLVEAFLPRTKRSLAVARQAGFRMASWGTRAILFERPA